MLGGLVRLILFRVLGARAILALAAFGWLWRMLGRRAAPRQTRRSPADWDYQPSHGESQIVQREPR